MASKRVQEPPRAKNKKKGSNGRSWQRYEDRRGRSYDDDGGIGDVEIWEEGKGGFRAFVNLLVRTGAKTSTR